MEVNSLHFYLLFVSKQRPANEQRNELYCQKNSFIANIPRFKDALLHHVKRYQNSNQAVRQDAVAR